MGYYLKIDDRFLGYKHRLVLTKDKARYFNHPSAIRDTLRALKAKNMVPNRHQIYTWTTDTPVSFGAI